MSSAWSGNAPAPNACPMCGHSVDQHGPAGCLHRVRTAEKRMRFGPLFCSCGLAFERPGISVPPGTPVLETVN